MTPRVFFNTTNDYKWEEFQIVAGEAGIDVGRLEISIAEINSLDLDEVVRRKTLETFSQRRLPVLVEHGSLRLEQLGGLPGPLSKPFWDTLGGNLVKLVADDPSAVAESGVGFCDGRTVRLFRGSVKGHVVAPRGVREFQWDPVFVPDGADKTLAELSAAERTKVSQFTQAMRAALSHLAI